MSRGDIVAADIGGTNARFARARHQQGRVELDDPVVLGTGDYPTFADAWRAYLKRVPNFEPKGASLALAGPVSRGRFKLTNAEWSFDTQTLGDELGLPRAILLNDFEAIAHAVAGELEADHLTHLAGPEGPLPRDATITVIGPGTGLGIAYFHRSENGADIRATEGSHIDFAPVREVDDRILALLREEHGRVSVERVISGDGIRWVHAALQNGEPPAEELPIWKAGLGGDDPAASQAVDHFVATLGRIAGDYALAHGSGAVVLAGGLGLRLRERLCHPAFHDAFTAKGRYRAMMEDMPVKLITHSQPGLLGAARAFFARP